MRFFSNAFRNAAAPAALCCVMGCSDETPRETPNACANIESGEAVSIEFIVHNAASTPRKYATQCDSPFRVSSPNGAYAPPNPSVFLCTTAPASCNSKCPDIGLVPFAANASQSFVWNGVVYEPVNAAEHDCEAANAGASCFANCVRRRDAEMGTYNLTIRLYEEDLTLTEWETTFDYPQQTKLQIDIP